MALYVRFLSIRGHDVEVTVARADDGCSATLRIFSSGPDSPVLHTIEVRGATADEVDRVSQAKAREWLHQRRNPQAQESPSPRP